MIKGGNVVILYCEFLNIGRYFNAKIKGISNAPFKLRFLNIFDALL